MKVKAFSFLLLVALTSGVMRAEVTDVTNPAQPYLLSAGTSTESTDLSPTRVPSPSFDCAKAKSPVEKMICEDPNLADADRDLTDEYRTVLACSQSIKRERTIRAQRRWFQARERCASKECIQAIYQKRLNTLYDDDERVCFPATAPLDASKSLRYYDADLGFEFLYPKEARLSKKFEGSYLVTDEGERNDPATNGGPVIAVNLSDGKAPGPDVEIRITVEFPLPETGRCRVEEGDFVGSESSGTVTIGGRLFRFSEFADGGMSHFLSGFDYEILHQGRCFRIRRFITGTNRSEDDGGPKTSVTKRAYRAFDQSLDIVKSFRFIDQKN